MKKLFTTLALAVVAALAVASPALAYGEPTGPNTVAIGGSTQYTFENIPSDIPSIDVSVDGPGDVILSGLVTRTYAVSGGTATISVLFPVSGAYTITGTGTGPLSGSFTHSLTVQAVVRSPDSGSLSSTGVDVMPVVWFGGGAVLLGVAILVILLSSRRSRRRSVA